MNKQSQNRGRGRTLPKLNRKRVVAASGLFLVVIIAWAQISLSSRATPVKTVTAEIGNIDILVSAPAKVSLPSRAELSFKSGGRIQEINVRKGDKVVAGQVLATLDMNSILPQINQAQAGLKIAQAGLDKLRSGRSHAELSVSQAQVDQAATAVNNARRSLKTVNKIVAQAKKKAALNVNNASLGVDTAAQQLNKVRSGVTSQQLDVAIAQRDQASQALADAQLNYNKVTAVNSKSYAEADQAYQNAVNVRDTYASTTGDTTSTTYVQYNNAVTAASAAKNRVSAANDQALQAAQAQVDSAQKASDIANAQYNLTTASARNEDLTIAQNQLKQAQISLEIAKIGQDDGSLDSQLDGAQGQLDTALKALNVAVAQLELQKEGPRAADLKQAQGQIEQAQAQLESAQSVAEDAVLKAPFSGRVAAVNGKAGEIAGMSAAASAAAANGGGSSSLITLINFDRIELTADVDEADIGKVKVGQDVSVKLDAYEDKNFNGKVTDISLLSAKNSTGGTIFQITIVLNPGKSEFREGMGGDVDVTVASKKNVLIVPFDAVTTSGKKTVFVVRNGVAQEQEVKVGLSSDTSYEIISGLKEGDRVVVGKSTITNGQQVKIES